MQRFYIDLSFLRSRTSGVAVYATRLGRFLEERFRCRVVAPPAFMDDFDHPIAIPEPLHYRNSVLIRAPLTRRSRGVRLDDDTFVYAPHMRPLMSTVRQAVTVHDLIHHFYPTRNGVETAFNKLVLPRLLPHLSGVLTVSEASKEALCRLYRLQPERVKVVPNGIDVSAWRPSARPPASEPPYLLVVSANRPYKNTIELLEQHDLWKETYRLIIVNSRARYGDAVRGAVNRLRLERVVDFRDDVSETDLIRLYQDCTATVYPSLMEGFGRPALEAMAVGRPVILSDIPVHRENFSGAAIFVTPGSRDNWRRAFTALTDHALLETTAAEGLRIANALTWDACGYRLVQALLEVSPTLGELRR
jgi:glycosyltransferase involved in cell wall biosynthesis